MNTNFEWSPAPASKRLLDVCRDEATEAEWSTYVAAAQLGPEALRKTFPDDFSECAPGSPTRAYHDRPFADPDAAKLYLQGRSVARDLLVRAVRKMADQHWRAEARRAGQAMPGRIDFKLVLELDVAIDATTLDVEGVQYFDLAFRPVSADRFEELVDLIREHEPRMDPQHNTIADFRHEIAAIAGKLVADATFREAMHAAQVSPAWFAKGRKAGTPSHNK